MKQLRKYELVKFGLDKVDHPRRDRRGACAQYRWSLLVLTEIIRLLIVDYLLVILFTKKNLWISFFFLMKA